ncbi:MAG: hypothetical protein ACRCU2_21890, partial [Planktothrix sp.]
MAGSINPDHLLIKYRRLFLVKRLKLEVDLKIWHIGSSSSPQKVCGVNNTVWLIATEQVLMGHDVTLIVNNPPDISALKFIA